MKPHYKVQQRVGDQWITREYFRDELCAREWMRLSKLETPGDWRVL